MLLTATQQDLLREATDRIAEAILVAPAGPADNVGLLSGQPGIAFFLILHGSLNDAPHAFAAGTALLEAANAHLATAGVINPTFAGGLAGYGWTLEYLAQRRLIAVDTDELLEEVDDYLYVAMNDYFDRGNFDFLHGAGGILLYLLRRLAGPTVRQAQLRAYLAQAVDRLEQLGTRDGRRIKWKASFSYGSQEPIYNISLSHGMASIVVLLGKILRAGIQPVKSRTLLTGAAAYLLDQRQDAARYGSHFPSYSLKEGRTPQRSRLGWCYGDLGVANSLLLAGDALGDDHLTRVANGVIDHLRQRRDLAADSIHDACVCHGAAGIALFAHRLRRLADTPENREFAAFWTATTLELGQRSDGVGGYAHYDIRDNRGRYTAEPNFLEGAAGIGTVLATLAHPEAVDLDWLETLLLC